MGTSCGFRATTDSVAGTKSGEWHKVVAMVDSGFLEVADRVFVARYPQWDVNVGLVLGRDGAVVVDTRASSLQGFGVLDDIRRLGTDIEVTHVVNTHVHFDHTFGNAAFTAATVHAHANVARSVGADAERIKAQFRADPGNGSEAGYTSLDVIEVLASEIRVPDRTFERSATIDLGDRAVTMSWAGRGHTDGDISVHVPDADAMFLGDLIEESAPPSFGGDCWPLDWADTLTEHLGWLGPESLVVPGHGNPVGAEFVRRQRDDITMVGQVTRERRDAGWSLEAVVAEPDARLPYDLGRLGSALRRGWEQLAEQPAEPA
jgi:glyoxylase-like metal-dependent hydrolase (beta-lactamase superfamily II)